MSWGVLEGHERFDERGIAKAKAQGRKWSKADARPLGPQWWGSDRRHNSLYATRVRAFFIGAWLVLVPLLLLWGFVSGPRGMIPKSAVELMLILGIPLGLAALSWGYLMPRYWEGARWRLSLDPEGLHYEAKSYWAPFGSAESWSVRVQDVSRVETGPAADWEPTRSGFLRDKPTPREEMQTFLFMADGSRRVVATVHGGRESLLTLAESIRSSLPTMREQTERAATKRALSSEPGEGFRV